MPPLDYRVDAPAPRIHPRGVAARPPPTVGATAGLPRRRAGAAQVLTSISEELLDVPLYYTLPDICSTLHCSSPKMAEVRAALGHAGYRSSQHHRDPDAIKTDAPPRVLWDIMRCWIKKHPISEKRLAEGGAASKILAVEPQFAASFATTAALRAKQSKARRWAPNPESYWGPKAAARGRKAAKTE